MGSPPAILKPATTLPASIHTDDIMKAQATADVLAHDIGNAPMPQLSRKDINCIRRSIEYRVHVEQALRAKGIDENYVAATFQRLLSSENESVQLRALKMLLDLMTGQVPTKLEIFHQVFPQAVQEPKAVRDAGPQTTADQIEQRRRALKRAEVAQKKADKDG